MQRAVTAKYPHLIGCLLALLLWAGSSASQQGTTVNPDAAATDDQTPVLIDVTANDFDGSGRPLHVTLGTNGCPGTVESLFDGTLLFTPTSPVGSVQTCTIGYGINNQNTTVTLTISPHSGGGGTGACGGNWGVGVLQPDGQGFEYQGQDLFLAGFYPGMHTLSRTNHNSQAPTLSTYHRQLIDTLAARDINLMRTYLTVYGAEGNQGDRHMTPYAQHPSSCCTASPSSGSGVTWNGVNRYDLDQWNDAFFDHWNEVIGYAKSQGVMMVISLFETRSTWEWEEFLNVGSPPPGFAHGRKFSLLASQNNVNGVAIDHTTSAAPWYSDSDAIARQTAFVREALRRLGGHDNVIWELANEPPIPSRLSPATLAAWQDDICTALRQGEASGGHPRHAVMPTDLPEHRDVPGHFTPGGNENFSGIHTDLKNLFAQGPGPLIADNDCCFSPGTTTAQRKKAWTSLVSGAHPLLFNFRADGFYGTLLGNTGNLEAVQWVGNTRRLVVEKGLDLAAMVPQGDPATGPQPVWLRAHLGEQYLAYFLNGGSATLTQLPTDFVAQWFDPRAGTFSTATATNVNGNSATFSAPSSADWVLYLERSDAVTPPETQQQAFGGVPHVVGPLGQPIEAEHYDELVDEAGQVILGEGEGETYHDSTAGNGNGGSGFRPQEDVDVLIAGRTYVNQTTSGEWLEYTVDVSQPGPYALYLLYATRVDAGDGVLRLDVFDGDTLEASQVIPVTNSNDADPDLDWQHVIHCETFSMGSGSRTLRLTMNGAKFNLDKFQLVPAATAQSPWGGTPRLIPGVIEAEHFDVGPAVGYCDATPENHGVEFRQDDWVDIVNGDGNHVIAWAEPGEWLEYTVNVTEAGTHEVEVTYATLGAGLAGRVRIDVLANGSVEDDLTFDLPVNGAPGPYEDRMVGTLTLSAGPKEVRWQVIDAGFAFAKLRIGESAPPPTPIAADNSFFFSNETPLYISADELLSNDEPFGQVEIDLNNPIGIYPNQGTLTWQPGQNRYVYVSSPDLNETQTFRYRIRVIGHPTLTHGATVSLAPLGDGPVAVDDDFLMPPGTTLTITASDLMDNDEARDALFDEIVTSTPGLITASTSPLTFEYSPPFGSGTATFQYRLRSQSGIPSNTATVTITVSPSAGRPVANDETFRMAQKNLDGSTAELTILHAHVLLNDVAAQGGNLTIDSYTNPQVGAFDNTSGGLIDWQYVPLANWQGTDSFTYTPEEGGITAADSATVEVTVVPAPIGTADAFTTGHNTPLVLAHGLHLTANDQSFGAPLHVVTESFSLPEHGTLDTTVSGQVTYLPEIGWSGTETFTYVAANDLVDTDGLWKTRSEPVTVSVTVLPSAVLPTDDNVLMRRGLQRIDIPLSSLFLNDSPGDELVLVGHGSAALGTVEWVGQELRYTPGDAFHRFGEDAFTYTVRRQGNPHVEATATVTLTSDVAYAEAFADDFEAADLSSWDRIELDAGHQAYVSQEAAASGLQGLEVLLGGGGGGAYIESTDPGFRQASHVTMAVEFDPSRLTMAEGNHHALLYNSLGYLSMARQNGVYIVRSWIRRQTGGYQATGWYELSGGPQRLQVEWWASSAPGQDNGATRLWIDDLLIGEKHGVDNDTHRALVLRLGAIWGIDAGTSGPMSFDAVEVRVGRRNKPIQHEDDFGSGHFGAWTGSLEVDGTVAHSNDQRLAVSPAGSGSVALLYADTEQALTHYGARFTFDPGSLILPDGQHFFLFGATGAGGWTSNVRLLNQGGDLQVALVGTLDNGHANSGWHSLGGGTRVVEWEWWAASGPGEDDGGQRLWIDDVLVSEFLGVDNDTSVADRINLGAVAALDNGTSGTFYLDDFMLWSGEGQRSYFAVDDFATGISSDWSHQVEVGGTVGVESVAAFGGSQALAVHLDEGATAVYLRDQSPDEVRSYNAQMRWHMGSLTMFQGELILLGGAGEGSWTVSARLAVISGEFYLRLVAATDTGSAHSGWIALADTSAVYDLGIDWQAASAPGANDGRARLWLDGVVIGELSGLDNDSRSLDTVELGATGNINFGTAGTFYFDDFVSWQ